MNRRNPLARRSPLRLDELETRSLPSVSGLLQALSDIAEAISAPIRDSLDAPAQSSTNSASRAADNPASSVSLVVIQIELPFSSFGDSVATLIITFTRQVTPTPPINVGAMVPSLPVAIPNPTEGNVEPSSDPLVPIVVGRLEPIREVRAALSNNPTTAVISAPPIVSVPASPVGPVATPVQPAGSNPSGTDAAVAPASRGLLTFPTGTFFVEAVAPAAEQIREHPAPLHPLERPPLPRPVVPPPAPDAGPRLGPLAFAEVDEVEPDADVAVATVEPAAAPEVLPAGLSLAALRADPFGLAAAFSAALAHWWHRARRSPRQPRPRLPRSA